MNNLSATLLFAFFVTALNPIESDDSLECAYDRPAANDTDRTVFMSCTANVEALEKWTWPRCTRKWCTVDVPLPKNDSTVSDTTDDGAKRSSTISDNYTVVTVTQMESSSTPPTTEAHTARSTDQQEPTFPGFRCDTPEYVPRDGDRFALWVELVVIGVIFGVVFLSMKMTVKRNGTGFGLRGVRGQPGEVPMAQV